MSAADPGLFALKSALRAAIIVPLAFVLALVVVGSKQMALFSSFGSMALLVFVDFGGSRAGRLRAYLGLMAVGCVLIALGTLCSRSAWLATVAMALVAFAILFSGVISEQFAAATLGAMLTFVLPVMVPADAAAIPTRLAGWGIAGALSISASLLLWPERPRGALRAQAGGVARSLAKLVEATAAGDPSAQDLAVTEHKRARDLRARFVSLPHRPSGNGRRTAALGRLVEDLGWLSPIAARMPAGPSAGTPFAAERAEVEAATPAALHSIAARLELGEERAREGRAAHTAAQLKRLSNAYQALGHAVLSYFAGCADEIDEQRATHELEEAYRLRQLSFGALQTGRDALIACGERIEGDPLQTWRARFDAGSRLALTHASMRSVWFRNSLRGAIGLAVAVLVGQLSDLQHAFWIVLGTMSVLRSNALATSTTIAWALLGTFVGIVGGGLLVAAVGSHRGVLWAVLPFAVLLAAYAPRAISFAAGQAAFSLTVLVLFNLIAPEGWKVGLVRVEDVAIGTAVSLLAGVLIWPRGATAVLREALGAAYARSAAFLDATIDGLLGDAPSETAEPAGREAVAAAQLLDSTIRQYLGERSSARAGLDDLSVLSAGAGRVRRVARLLQNAHELTRLTPVDETLPRLAQARDAFEAERHARCAWYASLGDSLSSSTPSPPPERSEARDSREPPAQVVLEREPRGGVPPGLAIAWAHRHLATLADLEPMLARAATQMRTGQSIAPDAAAEEPAVSAKAAASSA